MNYYRLIEINTEKLTTFCCDVQYHIGEIVRWEVEKGTWIVLRKL